MAKLRVGMAQNSVYSTYASFMPTISANLGYSFTAGDNYNSIPGTPYGNIVRNLNTSNNFSGSISASMNLISFGRDYYKLKISKHNKKISEYDLDLNEEQLILNVLAMNLMTMKKLMLSSDQKILMWCHLIELNL